MSPRILYPTPILTPDQKQAYEICDDISRHKTGKCSQCTRKHCQKAIESILKAIESSWIPNILGRPLGTNSCIRQANDIVSRLPQDLDTNPCVSFIGTQTERVNRNYGLTTDHVYAKVVMCNGTSVNGDNKAWGGPDRLWVGPHR